MTVFMANACTLLADAKSIAITIGHADERLRLDLAHHGSSVGRPRACCSSRAVCVSRARLGARGLPADLLALVAGELPAEGALLVGLAVGRPADPVVAGPVRRVLVARAVPLSGQAAVGRGRAAPGAVPTRLPASARPTGARPAGARSAGPAGALAHRRGRGAALRARGTARSCPVSPITGRRPDDRPSQKQEDEARSSHLPSVPFMPFSALSSVHPGRGAAQEVRRGTPAP